MVGKDYVFTAPAQICRDKADVYYRPLYGALVNARCRPVSAGLRFRVEEAVALDNDGRTLLRIAGPDVAGYMPYQVYLPKPYKTAQEYFPTGK